MAVSAVGAAGCGADGPANEAPPDSASETAGDAVDAGLASACAKTGVEVGGSGAADGGRSAVVASAGPGPWHGPGSPELLRLEELWPPGGPEEWGGTAGNAPGALRLPQPGAPTAGPDGRVAIPDLQLGRVAVVDPDGAWSFWGRRGPGPGELTIPVAAAWDTFGALAPGARHRPSGHDRAERRPADAGARLGADAAGLAAAARAVGPGGILAVAGGDSGYRIEILDREGAPVRTICREAPPLPVSPKERGEGARADRRVLAGLWSAPTPERPQAFGRLFWGARGRLWVQRERPSPVDRLDLVHGVPGALYDVFDEAGRHLGYVRAPEGARLEAAVGDTVWGLEINERGEPVVVAYRIVRE